MLDAMPNVYTEVGAVLYDIGRQPRAAHDFFVKYQDRILFGKDSFQPEEYPYYWRVFETRDDYFDYYRDYHAFWKLYGIDLPDDGAEEGVLPERAEDHAGAAARRAGRSDSPLRGSLSAPGSWPRASGSGLQVSRFAAIELRTAYTTRSQRGAWNGKASAATLPRRSRTARRIIARPRCSRVFTASSANPSATAVSLVLIPSTSRSMNTIRYPSGSASTASSSTRRSSLA